MNMMATLNLRAMVINDNGEPKTTSYAVAEAFGKRHSDVLRSIKRMKCSQSFRERNFAFTLENKQIGNAKRNTGFYQMTKDGWMFLVMGFTGERADAIKEQFIDAFNWMANQLSQVIQSKWARYNSLTSYHQGRKSQISGCASAMGQWRWEKEPLESEIKELECQLQPQLDFKGGK
ncbi:Rha family transcriptional regulator [Acinetobacter proteolyticus]|nr:Rha family transcriptional regulator [Acinetobacter proteolyticus]WEI20125.1 Rha family transcriptional regulator [Acinetobacter proteolyticus]